MTTTHTPGPWKIASTYIQMSEGWGDIVTWADQDCPLATIRPKHLDAPESIANMQLIASAPDLLSALEAIASLTVPQASASKSVWVTRGKDWVDAINTARSAIAKAKGQS